MKISKKLVILGLLLAAFAGCDKNPTKPRPEPEPEHRSETPTVSDSDSLTTVILTIEDKRVNSLVNIGSRAFLGGLTSDKKRFSENFNIENTKAVLDSVPPGEYQIFCTYDEYDNSVLILRVNFDKSVELEGQKTIEIRFVIPKEIPLNIPIMSSGGGTIKGAEISTEPETVTVITDEYGFADFGIIPLRDYTIYVKKYDITLSARLYIYNVGFFPLDMNNIWINRQPPIIEIISPPEIHYQNNCDIHLIGDGYDFEDGSLPDSSLTWYSDIDGELGKGRELKIPRLNVGNHTITLVGTDSNRMEGESSVQLNLSFSYGVFR